MPPSLMRLKVLLPFQVFTDTVGVKRIVAETNQGSCGFLPQRLDCVAVLVPGILVYETEADGDAYVAVDEGVLVKTGWDVLVSTRNAIGGGKLEELRAAVEQQFLTLNEHERSVRSVLARMESGFIRQMARLHHE